jgi:DNA-binding NtrC family response regulator
MKKIMIIDDELNITDILERYLLRQNLYEIKTFSNPQHALEEFSKTNYDLVLTDIMMPMISGMDILSEIKKISSNTKVILMTAYSSDQKIEQSEFLKADGYIQKPFESLKEVEEIINKTLK